MKSGSKTCRVGTVEVTHNGKRRGRKKMLSPEEFKKKSEEYFDECKAQDEAPSIAGLAFHLGFSSKQSIFDYRKDPEYAHEANRATLFIEAWLNKKVVNKDTYSPGQWHILKSNFGYEDKRSLDHQSSDGSLSPKSVDSDIVKSLVDKLTD